MSNILLQKSISDKSDKASAIIYEFSSDLIATFYLRIFFYNLFFFLISFATLIASSDT